jgi:DinB superfamily
MPRSRSATSPVADKVVADHDALFERLSGTPSRLAAAARLVPAEPIPAGEWTPGEIVRHLIAVEIEVWHARLDQLASQDHPTWPWAEPDRWSGDPGATLDALLERFMAERAATVSRLAALDDEGWVRTGTHATFGVLDPAGLMDRALEHDEDHVRSLTDRPV